MPNSPKSIKAQLAAINKELLPQVRKLAGYLETPEGFSLVTQASKFVSRWLNTYANGTVESNQYLDMDEAKAFSTLLLKHPSAQKTDASSESKRAILVNAFGEANMETIGGFEAAAIIAAGSLALGLRKAEENLLARAMVETALSADGISLLFRLALTRQLDSFDINHPLFGLDVPLIPFLSASACLGEIRAAIPGAAAFASQNWGSTPKIPKADASGISGLSVYSGSCNQSVILEGGFPDPRPAERYVVFPTAEGRYTTVRVVSWSAASIEVLTPEEVGDGPVGFNVVAGGFPEANPGALIELGEALGNCLGAGGRSIGLKLSSLVPTGPFFELQAPPRLAGDVNVFHGGADSDVPCFAIRYKFRAGHGG